MSINNFLANIGANGGMSYSNNFVVKFVDPPVPIPGKVVGSGNYFEMFCDEAQLPNSSTATGEIKGRYVGEGSVNYAHTRVFSEFQLGFQCDANMTALKFLQSWYGWIYNDLPVTGVGLNLSLLEGAAIPDASRSIQLNYPEDYCRPILITKTEMGGNNSAERASITYRMERAWPFAIDAVPLQFGSSQITKVTAQFHYTRHTVYTNDITNNDQWKQLVRRN